jgi:hypothetical protein
MIVDDIMPPFLKPFFLLGLSEWQGALLEAARREAELPVVPRHVTMLMKPLMMHVPR